MPNIPSRPCSFSHRPLTPFPCSLSFPRSPLFLLSFILSLRVPLPLSLFRLPLPHCHLSLLSLLSFILPCRSLFRSPKQRILAPWLLVPRTLFAISSSRCPSDSPLRISFGHCHFKLGFGPETVRFRVADTVGNETKIKIAGSKLLTQASNQKDLGEK